MDSKRKADSGSGADSGDRSSKRRKVSDFDLTKGETKDSTTAYGLAFLEQIRRTSDKNGRLIATYFEKLIPRPGNADYYKKTRMPISLETVEEKLDNGDFKNLAELESYFKRMIANAKEFYPRSSTTFDDAERFRKALSNFMTKNNPAYAKRGYQAFPTPLPDEDVGGEGDDDQEEEGDENGGEEEAAEEKEEEEEDQEEEEQEEEEEPEGPRRKSIILKRKEEPASSRSRPRRSSAYQASPKPATTPAKADGHQYEDIPYKGLSFQEAQEKIVEELLRHHEPEYEEAYFEPFVNLPPRALKDYYRIVTDPLSLKKLQKIVKGIQGRGELTGVSEFKSWAAFEEKSKLLWTNAYFYNEEGSEIYSLAQELEKMFNAQLKKAKAAVPEPAQSKIKLRVGGHGGTDTPSTKKITIHVGGRGNEESPAPAPGIETPATTNDEGVNGAATPVAQAEDGTPANAPTPGQLPSGAPRPPGLSETPVPVPPPAPNPAQHNETRRSRGPGKGINDALISRLSIRAVHPMQYVQPNIGSIYPDPKYLQQSGVINVPQHCNRVFVIAVLPEFMYERHYSLWMLINRQPVKPYQDMMPGQQRQELVFEVGLHPGVNVVEAHLIAAIPGDQREAGGPESELEIFTAYVNVMKN